ncbi:MAG: hypothetical protein ACREQL_09790, partial [Candidatus Binatia bacterium]
RDAGLALRRATTAARCRGEKLPHLLASPDGLGFAESAAACSFTESRDPSGDDLVACMLARAGCLAERAVAETVPRAYEFVSEVDDDPEAHFPCLTDPDELGSPSGAFVDGPPPS